MAGWPWLCWLPLTVRVLQSADELLVRLLRAVHYVVSAVLARVEQLQARLVARVHHSQLGIVRGVLAKEDGQAGLSSHHTGSQLGRQQGSHATRAAARSVRHIARTHIRRAHSFVTTALHEQQDEQQHRDVQVGHANTGGEHRTNGLHDGRSRRLDGGRVKWGSSGRQAAEQARKGLAVAQCCHRPCRRVTRAEDNSARLRLIRLAQLASHGLLQ